MTLSRSDARREYLLREAARTRNRELLDRLEEDAWEVGSGDGVVSISRPLEGALKRGKITPRQYGAGIDYRRHWQYGGLERGGCSSMDFDRVSGRSGDGAVGMPRTENEAHHRGKIRAANTAVGGVARQVLEMIVINDTPLEAVGNILGWGHKSSAVIAATERLRASLDALKAHWGGA